MAQRSWRRLATDGVLAAALTVVGVVGTAGADELNPDDVPVDGRAFALVLLAALALAARRTFPRTTLAVVTTATSSYLVLGYPYGPILLSFLVSAYTVARWLPIRRSAVALAFALLILLAHVFAGAGDRPGAFGVVPASAWVVVPFALGVTVRQNRETAARERAELLRRHADAERLRVAQEVHDVVGHGLAAINMQAEIALHLLPRRPEQAGPALEAIASTSRAALDELRATLAVVRRSDADGVDAAAADESRAPTAGLARLDDLLARMTGTGVPVRVETAGQRRHLPAAVDLAAYRVIQESLTNVLRHAGAASATVRLDYRPAELIVEVTDTGGGRSADERSGGGLGLAGMRERVTALGGAFTAGPLPAGGFGVRASLPFDPAEAGQSAAAEQPAEPGQPAGAGQSAEAAP